MNNGYVKVSAFTPEIRVADVEFNLSSVKKGIDYAVKEGAVLLALPELCLSGYTAADLFYSKTLLDSAKAALIELAEYTSGKNLLLFVGLPIEYNGKIYNVAAGICDGVILGIVPKTYMPEYTEFCEKRYFTSAVDTLKSINLGEKEQLLGIPFGKNIIFAHAKNQSLKVAVEVGSDINAIIPPSISHAISGARIIVNLSASIEYSTSREQRINLIKAHSQKAVCGYVYACAGEGESTTDCVFSGHNIIAENGEVLCQSQFNQNGLICAELDLEELDFNRNKIFNQAVELTQKNYVSVGFNLTLADKFSRIYDKTPFIKLGEEQILIDIAARGLAKRINHVNAQKLVIGISGGLDSTLALIVAVRAMQMCGKTKKDIISITMPCFGTSSRTFNNSIKLASAFGTSLKKIDITKAVKRHLKDIKHPEDLHDAAYENSQARERTQVLMDYANACNGIVVGTGDLSELALGFATYNGDHMSMYAVNGSVPKTLVRHLVFYTANNVKGKLKATLLDVLDTPVSPELIPSNDNTIKQVTEDIVGPYLLHDFFLYSIVKRGFTPQKTYYAAVNTFKGEFDGETIKKWLKIFVRRFFNQQFKRSCLPDGVKVTEISLSPRGAWKMPSDAISKLWLEQLENLD